MAFPLVPLIAAGASLLGTGISAGTAKSQQKKANKFNLDMWNRQNVYNSPIEQMKRLEEAGLNPNLIYGSGSASTGQASSAPTFEKMSDHGYEPVNVSGALQSFNSFQDYEIKRAQEDKIRTAIELDKQNVLLRGVETTGKLLANEKAKKQLPFVEELARTQLDALDASIKNTKAQTAFTLNSTDIASMKNARDAAESIERILNARTGRQLSQAQIANLREEWHVKNLDATFAKSGLRPTDPLYWRMIEKVLTDLVGTGGAPDDSTGSVWKKLYDLLF